MFKRVFQGCYKSVSRVFERTLKEISWRFERQFKGVSRRFHGFSKSVLGCFKEVSRKIEGCFNGVLSGFQGCLQEVEWCLRQVSKVFQASFKGVSRKIEGCFNGVLSAYSAGIIPLCSFLMMTGFHNVTNQLSLFCVVLTQCNQQMEPLSKNKKYKVYILQKTKYWEHNIPGKGFYSSLLSSETCKYVCSDP